MKNKVLKISLLLTMFCWCAEVAWALHIIGGTITYKYLGVGSNPNAVRYAFTMTIYRDCNGGGAPFDQPANIAIYRGTESNSALVERFTVNIRNISSIPAIPPPCVTSIPNVCVEEGIYVFERELPMLSGNDSYFVVYQRCCRNTTIRNIVTPGDQGATYMIKITREAMEARNNSPTFNNFPPIIVCAGLPLVFDHSGTDVDGDQLVYRLCPGLNGGGPLLSPPQLYSCEGAQPNPPCPPPFQQLPYNVPNYSALNPMAGNPAVGIHQSTGRISGVPTDLGQYVVTVCMEEYRNGRLLSTVQREFQFNVADCKPDVVADIEGELVPDLKKKFLINSCGNLTVKFINESTIKSRINDLIWEFDLNNGNKFVATGKNNWDVSVNFPAIGQYNGILILNPNNTGCSDTARIVVNVFPEINADFSYDYDVCVAGPVVFTDKSSGTGGLQRWEWNYGVPNGRDTLRNPSFLFPYPGNHPVQLIVTDRNKCRDTALYNINWYPAPPVVIVQPDKFLGCVPAEVFFKNKSFPIDSTYFIEWDFGDGNKRQGVISPTHRYEKTGIFDVKLSIKSPLGCFISDSFPRWIRTVPAPIADFTFEPASQLSILNNTVKFSDKSVDAWRWNWQFDRFKTSTEQNPSFTFPDTGQFTIRLIVTHQSGCKDSISKIIDIVPEVRWFMPNAFTPNGDGTNDEFFGKGYLEGISNFQMTIWNRWGELVFETSDPNVGWNGRVMNTGGMSPPGVYVYLVTYTEPRGKKMEFRGFATLIK